MSSPIKDNEHILADQQAFMEAVDRARERFAGVEGVESVGFGQKQSGGTFTDDAAIVVFVREKRPEEEIAPEDRVPSTFEGYRTDVRTLLRNVPGGCDNDSSYGTIQGGIQISVGNGVGVGTLGCMVRKRGDSGRENVYLLSNHHVLFFGGARAGDYAYHPDTPAPAGSSSSRASASLGPIQPNSFYRDVTTTVPDTDGTPVSDTFFIDCAIARMDLDSKCLESTCTQDKYHYSNTITDLQVNGVNTLAGVRSVARDPSIVVLRGTAATPDNLVFKVGRTTGKTRGIVRSVGATLGTVDVTLPGNPPVLGHNVIEIDFDPASNPPTGLNCHGKPWFAEHGDSGSIVVDSSGRVIGIITGVNDDTTPPGQDSVTACHILPVLDKLGICIPTTAGTTHGNCAATDGSGTAPAAAVGSGGTGGVLELAMAAPSAPAFPPPAPVRAEEQARMFALRDAFIQTAKGRELHQVFALVRREVAYLVRNSRPVKVAWHRHEGPAFFAHVLIHLRGETDTIPLQVNGVTRAALLERMAQVLAAHGSNPLRAALERYHDELMPILSTAADVHECTARVHEAEAALAGEAP